MKVIIEVKTFKQMEDILSRIAENTGVELRPEEDERYRNLLQAAINRVVSGYIESEDRDLEEGIEKSADDRVAEQYAKEKLRIHNIVESHIAVLIARLPKKFKVYAEGHGSSRGFTLTFSDKSIRGLSKYRIDKRARKRIDE